MNKEQNNSITNDEKTLLENSIEKFLEIRLLHNIGQELGMIDEKDKRILEKLSLQKKRISNLNEWKVFSNDCNSHMKEIKTRVSSLVSVKLNQLSQVIEGTTSPELHTERISFLLGSAKKKIKTGDITGSYPYLEHVSHYTLKVIEPYNEFTLILKNIKDELDGTKPFCPDERKQIENLIHLAVETAKRDDRGSAIDILNNCRRHIEENRSAMEAQRHLQEFQLTLSDLKDITLRNRKYEEMIEKLEEKARYAKKMFHEKEYQTCLDTITSLREELQVAGEKIRKRYCSQLMNDIWSILDNNADGIIIQTSDENKYKGRLDEMDRLMKREKYPKAVHLGENIFKELKEVTFQNCKKYCQVHGPKIDKLINGLQMVRMEKGPVMERYRRYVHLEGEGRFIECRPIIDEIKRKAHICYENNINGILESIKNREIMKWLESEDHNSYRSRVSTIRADLAKKKYTQALEILKNIVRDIEKGELKRNALKVELSTLKDQFGKMGLENNEREKLELKFEMIEKNMGNEKFLLIEKDLETLRRTLRELAENKLQTVDFLKYEMEEMGIAIGNIFLDLEEALSSFKHGDYITAYNLATKMKNAVRELKQGIVDDSFDQNEQQKDVAGKKEHCGVCNDTSPEQGPEEYEKEDNKISVEESLVSLETISEIELTEWTKILLERSRSISLKERSERGTSERKNILEIVHKSREILDILKKREIDIRHLESQIEMAVEEIEKGEPGKANDVVQQCINSVIELIEGSQVEESEHRSISNKLSEMRGVLKRFGSQGITLKGVEEILNKGHELAALGEIDLAENTVYEAELVLEQRLQQYHDLEECFEDIEERASALKKTSIDIEDTDNLFKEILGLAREGEYIKAKKICENCRAKLIRIEVLAPLRSDR